MIYFDENSQLKMLSIYLTDKWYKSYFIFIIVFMKKYTKTI